MPAAAAAPPARASSNLRRPLLALALLLVLAAAVAWTLWRDAPSGLPAAPPVPMPITPRAAVLSQVPGPASAPAPAAPAVALAGIDEMLSAPASPEARAWRFKANPAVLVIEFPSLHAQGLAMNRMAALFEKRKAPRDRVLDDGELAALVRSSGDSTATFYQGHDYPAARLARFFTLAASARTTLNAPERRLLTTLLDTGVLVADGAGGFSAPGTQAVVSFSALQADDPSTLPDESIDPLRRRAVLRHELSHGEYFTNPSYRAHSRSFWSRRLSAQERKVWRSYLAGLDYNPADEELMANETQAMLMHTPDPRAFDAGALGVGDAALATMRARFRAGEPAHGLAAAGR